MRKIALLLLVLLVSGCTKVEDNRVKITYQTMETLPEQRKALKQLVEEFEKANPNIKVEVLTSTTSFQKLAIQIAGGNAPDVFYYVTDRLPGLAKSKVLLSLDPYMEDIDMSKYFKKAEDLCKVGGKYYLFPFHYSTDVLFYNKDLFDKHKVKYPDEDWIWKDFLMAAKRLTVTENGKVVQYGTLQPRPLLVIKSFGGKCFNKNLTKCVLNSKETKDAIQFIMDLNSVHGVAPSAAAIKDMEKMDGIDMFSSGRAAMFMGRTFMLAEFRKLKEIDWDIANVPKGEKEYSRLAVGGNCISAGTKHPKEAWEFVKFYSGEKGSLICGISGNCVPALKEVAYSDSFLFPPPQNAELFVDSIEYAQSDNPGLTMWEEFYQRVIQENIDKILFGIVSIDDGLDEMQKEGDELLKYENKLQLQ